jgi:hypothetical protein
MDLQSLLLQRVLNECCMYAGTTNVGFNDYDAKFEREE